MSELTPRERSELSVFPPELRQDATQEMPDFDARVLATLRRNSYFRMPTQAEIDGSYAAYSEGGVDRLLAFWRAQAEPTRGKLSLQNEFGFRRAHLAPAVVNGVTFLAVSRSVLAAGKRLRDRLRPEIAGALAEGFPWLENRHTHIPDGWAPTFDFVDAIRSFLDGATVEQAKVRWQLLAAFNEVIQSRYSRYMAELFRIDDFNIQARREEELARNYFAHWSPKVGPELWRQVLIILDGMNAATLEMCCDKHLLEMLKYSASAVLLHRKQWQTFLDGLRRPQVLLPPPGATG